MLPQIWTMRDVEKAYNLSRQRIHKAIQRNEIPTPHFRDSAGHFYWTHLPNLEIFRHGPENHFRIDIRKSESIV